MTPSSNTTQAIKESFSPFSQSGLQENCFPAIHTAISWPIQQPSTTKGCCYIVYTMQTLSQQYWLSCRAGHRLTFPTLGSASQTAWPLNWLVSPEPGPEQRWTGSPLVCPCHSRVTSDTTPGMLTSTGSDASMLASCLHHFWLMWVHWGWTPTQLGSGRRRRAPSPKTQKKCSGGCICKPLLQGPELAQVQLRLWFSFGSMPIPTELQLNWYTHWVDIHIELIYTTRKRVHVHASFCSHDICKHS